MGHKSVPAMVVLCLCAVYALAAGPQRPMVWTGAWDSTATYATGDTVQYLGSAYTCTSKCMAGAQPSLSPAVWDLVALSLSGAAAGGSLTGTYPNPSIASHAVKLFNIDPTGAQAGDVLTYRGGANPSWSAPTLRLPFVASASSEQPLFSITSTNYPPAATFANRSLSGTAIDARTFGYGSAGIFVQNVPGSLAVSGPALNVASNSSSWSAYISHQDSALAPDVAPGGALRVQQQSLAGHVAELETTFDNPDSALTITSGKGAAIEVRDGRIVTAYSDTINSTLPADATVVNVQSGGTVTLPSTVEPGTIMIVTTSSPGGISIYGVTIPRGEGRMFVKTTDTFNDGWMAVH